MKAEPQKQSDRLNLTFPPHFHSVFLTLIEMEKETGITAAQLGRCAVIQMVKAYKRGEKIDFSSSL